MVSMTMRILRRTTLTKNWYTTHMGTTAVCKNSDPSRRVIMHEARFSFDTFVVLLICLNMQAVLYMVSILHLVMDLMLISSWSAVRLDKQLVLYGRSATRS